MPSRIYNSVTPSLRRTGAALALVLALGTAPAGAAAPGNALVLTGNRTASVEITLTSTWTIPPWRSPDGSPFTAKYTGGYGGFMVEQGPRVAGAGPMVVLGLLWAPRLYIGAPYLDAQVPIRFGTYAGSGGDLPPGRYRITLFADGPTKIVIPGGPAMTVHPRDPVDHDIRVGDLAPAGMPDAYVLRHRGITMGRDSIVVRSMFSRWTGWEHEVRSCVLPSTHAETTGCELDWECVDLCLENDNCIGAFGSRRSQPDGEAYALATMGREGDVALRPLVAPGAVAAAFPDVVPLAPVSTCDLPRGSYDVVFSETFRDAAPLDPTVGVALVVSPAPLLPVGATSVR